MKALGWIAPATWPAVVDALAALPPDTQITLVAVADSGESLPSPGLFGRGRPRPHEAEADTLTQDAASRLVQQAAERLGRACTANVLTGRTERMIVDAAQDADLLVLARDGDRSRLGPHSLGKHARFVLDHAPCTVQLLWPESAPAVSTIPPPPK